MRKHDIFFIYEHVDVYGHTFYIGQSSNLIRPFNKKGRGELWSKIASYGYHVNILHTVYTREKALKIEKEEISKRKGWLVNKNGAGSLGKYSEHLDKFWEPIFTQKKQIKKITKKDFVSTCSFKIKSSIKTRMWGYRIYNIKSSPSEIINTALEEFFTRHGC